MSLPTDEYFCRMMEQVWCISEDASSEATQSQVKFLIQTMRAKLLSKANNTTEEYLLRQLFESFDTNKSGDLTIDELWAMAAKLEISVERKYLAALFKVIDADNSGTIEFEEFCNFLINSPYKWIVNQSLITTHRAFKNPSFSRVALSPSFVIATPFKLSFKSIIWVC